MSTKDEIQEVPEASHKEVSAELKGEPAFTLEEEKRVYRKLDWNLLPLVFVLYSLSVLDRSNLGNAKIAGMTKEIDLSGNHYTWLATVFYIAYILSQWTTIGWKAFPPHKWAAFVVFSWGLVSTIQAACTSWAGIMVCRVLLGVIEAMYGPGVPLYLSFFYPREKLGLRTGIFLSGSALANAYGGALAYGISQAKASIGPWRILFIVEGVPSALLAVVAFFFLPDSPRHARFLDEREREIAVALSERQPGDRESHGLQLKQLFAGLLDYKSYPPGLMYFGCNVSFSSLPLFMPTILSEMGSFSTIQSNGLSAPPYLFCWIVIILCAFISDRVKLRGPFVVGPAFVAAIGFIVLGTQTGVAARYFGLFLAVQIFVSVAMILVWVGNSHATDSQRAGGYTVMSTLGQCGPLLGTNIFPSKDAPYYRMGMWVSCGACLLVALMGCAQMYILWRSNKKLDREDDTDLDDPQRFRYTV